MLKRPRRPECEIAIVVLHGGPGAPGSAAPIAAALGGSEPRLDALSIAAQIAQARAAIVEPTIVVGWSWGAMLGALVAAEEPRVQKLVLVASGPFDARYVAAMVEARRERGDDYDPIEPPTRGEFLPEVFEHGWSEAEAMRDSGDLLRCALSVACPVAAIHGDYDPHPVDGVRVPLAPVLTSFRLLEHCGHVPWNERRARDRFFELLAQECAP